MRGMFNGWNQLNSFLSNKANLTSNIMLHANTRKLGSKLCIKLGFTVAEVLIVVGIIGIIAEMTIPTLIANVNDMVYKTAWKKEYSSFESLVELVKNENGGTLEGLLSADDLSMNNIFDKYLNVRTSCHTYGITVKGTCWHQDSGWSYLNNGAIEDVDNPPTGAGNLLYDAPGGDILADGTLVRYLDYDCNAAGYCGYILFDINGFKNPNVIGKDIFGVFVFLDGITPFGSPIVNGGIRGEGTTCDPTGTGFPCSATTLYN